MDRRGCATGELGIAHRAENETRRTGTEKHAHHLRVSNRLLAAGPRKISDSISIEPRSNKAFRLSLDSLHPREAQPAAPAQYQDDPMRGECRGIAGAPPGFARGPDANENNVIVSWNQRPSRETWLAGNPAADTVVGHGSIETELQAGDSACSWRYCHGLDFLVDEIGPCAAVG